jgi:hypothetical protein
VLFLPFEPAVDFVRRLEEQEQAADDEEISCDHKEKSGEVSLITQDSENRRRMRVPIASSKPRRRADACLACGNRPDRMEMKMMLSTPRTISRKVSVARAIRISGDNQFIQHLEIACPSAVV